MMGMNFREAMHMIELRTTPQGHPSYRKICQQMMAAMEERHPQLSATLWFADKKDYYWSRSESEARQRRKEREVEEKFNHQDAKEN
jgi:thymidylate synthase ThyX